MVSSALTPTNCLFIWKLTSICISAVQVVPKVSASHIVPIVLYDPSQATPRHLAWSLIFLQGCVLHYFGFGYFVLLALPFPERENDTCFHGAPDRICFMGQRCCWPPDGDHGKISFDRPIDTSILHSDRSLKSVDVTEIRCIFPRQ